MALETCGTGVNKSELLTSSFFSLVYIHDGKLLLLLMISWPKAKVKGATVVAVIDAPC